MKSEIVAPSVAPLLPTDERRGLPRLQELGLVLVILIMGIGLSIWAYTLTEPGESNRFLNPSNLIDQIATPTS
jgi:hypothetical protein